MTEYKTIDELMEGKAPGEIKITNTSWSTHVWFRPYFKSRKWHGLDQTSDAWEAAGISYGGSTWKLYEEPKKKMKLRRAVVKSGPAGYYIPGGLYRTEPDNFFRWATGKDLLGIEVDE